MSHAKSPEKVVQEICRKTRRQFSAEEKIRIVLEGLRGEESIAALCRREIAVAIVTAVSKSGLLPGFLITDGFALVQARCDSKNGAGL